MSFFSSLQSVRPKLYIMIRKLKWLAVSEEEFVISWLLLNSFFLKMGFSFYWNSVVNKMHGSYPLVGGILKVVHGTRNVETSGTRKHSVQSIDPCRYILLFLVYCIIRRDETNQIHLVHGGYSVPGAVPSVSLGVQVAVLRRCSHALCRSYLKSIQEVQEEVMMHFSVVLVFL